MLMSLERKLTANEFVVLAEMDPPKGTDVSSMVENALRVKGKVDAYVVPEMGNAVMRMSALGASLILQNRGMQADRCFWVLCMQTVTALQRTMQRRLNGIAKLLNRG
jgi:hypothetical protein